MNRDEFRAMVAQGPRTVMVEREHAIALASHDPVRHAPFLEMLRNAPRVVVTIRREDLLAILDGIAAYAADRAPAASTPASLDVSSIETTPPSAMAAGDFREGRSSGPACGLHPHAGPSPHTSVGA
jgi:hypothetical protein